MLAMETEHWYAGSESIVYRCNDRKHEWINKPTSHQDSGHFVNGGFPKRFKLSEKKPSITNLAHLKYDLITKCRSSIFLISYLNELLGKKASLKRAWVEK